MPTAAASAPGLSSPAIRSRSGGWIPALLCLLLGFSAQLSFGPTWIDLRPGYLLPLVALWWARRDGRSVVVPVGLLTLLPDAFLRAGFLSLSFGYSDTTCVIAAGVALAFAPGDGPAALAASVRPARRWALQVAALAWVLAATDRGRHALRADGIEVALDNPGAARRDARAVRHGLAQGGFGARAPGRASRCAAGRAGRSRPGGSTLALRWHVVVQARLRLRFVSRSPGVLCRRAVRLGRLAPDDRHAVRGRRTRSGDAVCQRRFKPGSSSNAVTRFWWAG